MPTPSQAIANVRTRTHSNTQSYSDTIGIMHYNWSYQDVTGDIQLLDEEYFFDYGIWDTVIDQTEYQVKQLVSPTYGTVDITQVKNVLVKYTADQVNFINAREVHKESLEYGTDYYATRQNVNDPFYYIQDNSIFLYPAPTEAVTGGFKAECIIQPPDLLTADTIDKVFVPKRIQRIIEEWMMPFAYEYLGKENMIVWAVNMYDKRKKEALAHIKNRSDGIVNVVAPIQSQFR